MTAAASSLVCSVAGCDRPHVARGLCKKHYGAKWRAEHGREEERTPSDESRSLPRSIEVEIPLSLTSPNARLHWGSVARRRRFERAAVRDALARFSPPSGPVLVRLHRVGARAFDDHDNLRGAFKATVDEISAWLGRKSDRGLQVEYTQAATNATRIEADRFGHRYVVPDERIRIEVVS